MMPLRQGSRTGMKQGSTPCDKHRWTSLESVGLEKVADQTTLGEWLRAQTPESVRALCRLNSDFVKELIGEHAALWSGSRSYFYADSGSSEGRLLMDTAQAGFYPRQSQAAAHLRAGRNAAMVAFISDPPCAQTQTRRQPPCFAKDSGDQR